MAKRAFPQQDNPKSDRLLKYSTQLVIPAKAGIQEIGTVAG